MAEKEAVGCANEQQQGMLDMSGVDPRSNQEQVPLSGTLGHSSPSVYVTHHVDYWVAALSKPDAS